MEAVEHLNKLLASFDECRILSFDGCRLVVIGDWNLSYHHNFEAEFLEVSYLQCPTCFFAQCFRLATPQERADIDREINLADYTEEHDFIFCFESEGRRFFVVACELVIQEKLVLHHR